MHGPPGSLFPSFQNDLLLANFTKVKTCSGTWNRKLQLIKRLFVSNKHNLIYNTDGTERYDSLQHPQKDDFTSHVQFVVCYLLLFSTPSPGVGSFVALDWEHTQSLTNHPCQHLCSCKFSGAVRKLYTKHISGDSVLHAKPFTINSRFSYRNGAEDQKP